MATLEPSTVSISDARWAAVFARVIGVTEKGFVDDPHDHGGATKAGLSLRFLAAEARLDPKLIASLKIGHDGQITVPDIRALTPAQEQGVYRPCFWDGPGISALPRTLDAAVFDQAVNDGLSAAVELLQRALNSVAPGGAARLPVDGQLGAATHARAKLAAASVPAATLSAFRTFAAYRYRAVVKADPSQARFLDGWLSRAEHLGDV